MHQSKKDKWNIVLKYYFLKCRTLKKKTEPQGHIVNN